MKTVSIWTDGACSGNPGQGGWAALLVYVPNDHEPNTHEKLISGTVPEATNNRMELTAVIEALRALKEPVSVLIYTDSQYLIGGATGQHKRKANLDLWQQFDEAVRQRAVSIEFIWVRGHDNDTNNERVDQAARKQAQGA